MTNHDDKFIQFKNVTKRFGDVVALDSINLDVPKGIFLTLLGPSGCGKTTLMRQLAGFSEPEEGDVMIKGKRVNGLPPYKRNTPLVFQEYALFPHMTVHDNIAYGLKLQKISKAEIEKRVDEMLDIFNLTGLGGRFPRQLSGGQQQRVAFARALIMNQEILLLDEPLSNLDAKLRVEVRTELREIQQRMGITTIYVTHDQDEALSMSDQIAVMRQGRIEQLGTPFEIYFRPANEFVADFIGVVNFLKAVVTEADGTNIQVKYHDDTFKVISDVPFSKGDDVLVLLRPEYTKIHTAQSGKGELEGEVVNHSFLGQLIRYWIKCGDDTLIVDDPNPQISGPMSGTVRLELYPEKIHLLKYDPKEELDVKA